MKIQIYASSMSDAMKLASTMNLALRHWDYAGTHLAGTWADVGSVMDQIQES